MKQSDLVAKVSRLRHYYGCLPRPAMRTIRDNARYCLALLRNDHTWRSWCLLRGNAWQCGHPQALPRRSWLCNGGIVSHRLAFPSIVSHCPRVAWQCPILPYMDHQCHLRIVIDTSTVIAGVAGAAEMARLSELTKDATIVAPPKRSNVQAFKR